MTLLEIATDTTVEDVKAATDCDFEISKNLGKF